MATRTSTGLGYKAAQSLYYAIHEHAERIGMPLTHSVTINFDLTSIAPEDAVPAFQKLRNNHYVKWARRPQKGTGPAYEPTYAYVFENVRDGTPYDTIGPGISHNVHVHWLVHVPGKRHHHFEGKLYEWVDSIAGKISAAGAIHIQPITAEKGGSIGKRNYLLKGAHEHVAEHFGAEHSPQGAIIGRRSGTSRNLGPAARIAFDRAAGIRRRIAA